VHSTEQLNAALADRYLVERKIGEGGMATVYLARDLRHNRKVALKVLKPDLGAVVGEDRFLSEIEVTANLQHPNLLPLFDSGAADGLLFYVMPFVEGESLRAKLEREKQFAVDDAVRIASAVAGALDYAHRTGVIHRDLKPENILLHDGQPLVADFGIALAVSNAGGTRITQTGLSLGTPQYMSPEQATGDRVIDARSDVYALGAVTYEMLTGEAPHTGTTAQAIIARVLTEVPRSIRVTRPSVPEHVEAAVMHALEKLAPDRFATAKEFGEALTGVRGVVRYAGAPTAQRPMTAIVSTRTSRVRELLAWSLAASGIAAAVLARSGESPPLPLSTFTVQMPESVTIESAGNVAVLALSPDGATMVVQGSSRESGLALYVRRMDEPTMHLIRGTEGGIRPTFSPDGNDILFSSGGLRRIPVRGGTARLLVDSSGLATWTDNHEIVYTRPGGLYAISEDGGESRRIAVLDTARKHVSYSWPYALPGGKEALITIRVGENSLDSARLGVVSLETGRVTEFSPVIHGTNSRWSPTGHVMYATADGQLLAVPFSRRSLRTTGPPIPVSDDVSVGVGGAAGFAVAEGGMIAMRSAAGGGVEGMSFARVSRTGASTRIGPPDGGYRNPRVSPDGRTVAYTRFVGTAPGGPLPNPDIWLFDVQSGIPRRLTTDSVTEAPAWSPNGEHIAAIRRDGSVVWLPVRTTASPTVLLTDLKDPREISFGTRGGHFALSVGVGPRSSRDVLVGAVDAPGQLTPFAAQPYREVGARISPDDRLVAYTTSRTGTDEVVVRPLLGNGAETQVSSGGGGEPVWSRDGRELFYRVPGYLMAARLADGAVPAVISRDTLFQESYRALSDDAGYDVFPDGKSFVMLRGGMSDLAANVVTVLLHWRPPAVRAPGP